ncbi:hypothetical protein FTO70_02005 [Methanosarcina sp. KYL-1]|uniref:uracil-DNA glycosylase family protein n=1 Tax=Methanosarcina sp. KYL-1 TaxID=2602068 RepID=UPI002101CAEE|nr:uracil-DNA glycosylase family protein [Methanosarcina sp. KYL-1]MCQ1534488.1 hypothetical protein [Methanosarcina sp. KYL-1]
MNQELLTKICNDINSCPNWRSGSLKCGRDETAIPKTVEIKDTQKILLITRDPSNQANKLDDVTSFENSFFMDKVLPILFADYETEKAKKDMKYFEDFREKFLSLFYWTHYQKCFPGKREGAHKQPRKKCATRYLKTEIEAFDPEIIICIGAKAVDHVIKEAVERVKGEKLLQTISKNGNNHVTYSGKKIPFIALTHPSGSNNGAKNNPSYRYEETIKLIREKVREFE